MCVAKNEVIHSRHNEIVLTAIERGSDPGFRGDWRLVAVFYHPVKLVADGVAAVFDDESVRALASDQCVETFKGDSLENIVIAAAIIHRIAVEDVVSKASIQVGGKAIGHTNGGIVWRGIEDKAQRRWEIGIVLNQRVRVGIIYKSSRKLPNEPEPNHGIVAGSTLEGHMLGCGAVLEGWERAFDGDDLEVVGAILEVGDCEKRVGLCALEILGFSIDISVPDVGIPIIINEWRAAICREALVFHDIARYIGGRIDAGCPRQVVLEFARVGEIVFLRAFDQVFINKNLTLARRIHELERIRICEGERNTARFDAYSAIIAIFCSRERSKTGYLILTRLCCLIGHNKHELANAIWRLGDIDGTDEFIGSATSHDVIIHIVLHECVIAFASDHRIEASAAIEVVVTCAAVKIVVTKVSDNAAQEGLGASVLRSRCVDIWAGVEVWRVAVEGVI